MPYEAPKALSASSAPCVWITVTTPPHSKWLRSYFVPFSKDEHVFVLICLVTPRFAVIAVRVVRVRGRFPAVIVVLTVAVVQVGAVVGGDSAVVVFLFVRNVVGDVGEDDTVAPGVA